eukprot:15366566-Ditylum_brightwellii.AAC.1
MAEFTEMIANDYGVKKDHITARKPQANMANRVLVKGERSSKFGDYAHKGPYEIVEINTNGIAKIRKGSVTNAFNIKILNHVMNNFMNPIMG